MPRKNRPQTASIKTKTNTPSAKDRVALLHGPYAPPPTRIGKSLTCILRGKAKVCGWTDGPIAWPLIRVGHGGRGAYAMTPDLVRALKHESVIAISYWWGVSEVQVGLWRRALGVGRWNEGTRKLWSLWKEPKLPDRAMTISKAALRQRRLAKEMTQTALSKAMGWESVNTYHQLESGPRCRVTPQKLKRLAKILGCAVDDLIASDGGR